MTRSCLSGEGREYRRRMIPHCGIKSHCDNKTACVMGFYVQFLEHQSDKERGGLALGSHGEGGK